MSYIATAVVVAVAALLIWIGFSSRSKNTSDAYLIEEKKVPLFKVMFGIFSVVGAGEFVYVSELSYSFGIASAVLFVGFGLGALIFSMFFVKNLRQFHELGEKDERYNVFSIPDFAYIYNGREVSSVMTLFAVITLGSLLMIQFVLGGTIIQILTGMPYEYSVLLIASTVGIYVYFGGFNSILFTDIIQVVALFLIFSILAVSLDPVPDGINGISQLSSVPDLASLTLLIVGGICWVLGGSDIWQRITAAKSDKIAAKALLLNAGMLTIFGLILAYVGLQTVIALPLGSAIEAGQGTIEVAPGNAFEALLWYLPESIKIVVALGLFAGFISTADTEVHAISTIVAKEIFRGKKPSLGWAKICVATVTILSFISAIVFKNYIVEAYLVLLNVFIIMGGFMLPTLLGYGRRVTSLIGLCISFCIFVYLIFSGNLSQGFFAAALFIPPALCGFAGGKTNVGQVASSPSK